MSRAFVALICIRLDAQEGAPVAVADLAHYLGTSTTRVCEALERMNFDRLAEVERDATGAIASARTPDILHRSCA